LTVVSLIDHKGASVYEDDEQLEQVEAAFAGAEKGTTARPPCTGTCSGTCSGPVSELVDLSCGCQDVRYEDGTVCYEHNHVICG
jgi:hypothetical protein